MICSITPDRKLSGCDATCIYGDTQIRGALSQSYLESPRLGGGSQCQGPSPNPAPRVRWEQAGGASSMV